MNMKISNYIFVLIVGFMLFSACTSSKSDSAALLPELVEAESIMYEHPDSALHILESMPMPNTTDNFQQATWALLMTQARYKNYVEQSDTLINMAYDYFINKEDAQRRAMVLYYKGAICYEHKQIEEAQEWCLKAAEEVEKTQDYLLAHLVYMEIGNLYLRRSFYEYALENFEKALYYAQLAKNDSYICSSCIHLARSMSALSQMESSIKYYERAICISEKMQDYIKLAAAMNELGGVYVHIHDFKTALNYTKKALNVEKKFQLTDLGANFFTLGNIYRHLNVVDSAYCYLEKARYSSNIHTLCCTYQALYYLSRDNKKYEEMALYADKFIEFQDSIYTQNKSKELIEMQAKYDQQKVINDKKQMQIEKDKEIRNVLIILVIVLCLSALIVCFYQHKVILKERVIQQKEEELQKNVLQMQENETTIERNNERLKELFAQIAESQGIQEQLEEQHKVMEEIQKQNEMLKQENNRLQRNINDISLSLKEKAKGLDKLTALSKENRYLRSREFFLAGLVIKDTPVLQKLKASPKYIGDKQWHEIKEAINHLFDNYTVRLQQIVPSLTESDLQICCLVKLRIPNPDIAVLLGISSTSVSKRKLRLKERIVQELGTLGESHTLDLWLWEF